MTPPAMVITECKPPTETKYQLKLRTTIPVKIREQSVSEDLQSVPAVIDDQTVLATQARDDHLEIPPGSIVICIPDMFESFMATKPLINPHYEKVKAEAESWILEMLKYDEKICKAVSRVGFSSYAAMAAPEGGADELRLICDWGNWAFPFDDMFDFGTLKGDQIAARAMMDRLLSIMGPGGVDNLPTTPLLEIYANIWDRLVKNATKEIQERFKMAMVDYINGTMEQVNYTEMSKTPSVSEIMAARRSSTAALVVIVLVEYAHKVEIPDHVYNHPSLRELRRIVMDLVVIQNDALGYYKEQAEGVAHSLINVLRSTGLTIQEAFNHSGVLLRECYRDWYLAQASLPQWGEEIDRQVQRYIESLKSFILGNLNWHFECDRYLGSMKTLARKHRVITVLDDQVPVVPNFVDVNSISA